MDNNPQGRPDQKKQQPPEPIAVDPKKEESKAGQYRNLQQDQKKPDAEKKSGVA